MAMGNGLVLKAGLLALLMYFVCYCPMPDGFQKLLPFCTHTYIYIYTCLYIYRKYSRVLLAHVPAFIQSIHCPNEMDKKKNKPTGGSGK